MSITSTVPLLTDLLEYKARTPAENTLTDTDLGIFWQDMEEQGLVKWAFPTGDIATAEHLIQACQNPQTVWTFGGFSLIDHKPLMLAFLTNFEGSTARLHYVLMRNKEAREKAVPMALAFLDFIFWNGTLDSLLLITPRSYWHSNNFARNVGAKFLGQVPCLVPRKLGDNGDYLYEPTNVYVIPSPRFSGKVIRNAERR